MNTLTMPHMGNKLTVRLAELNMTLDAFGKMLGVTRQRVHQLTATECFHSKTTYRVAKALRVPVSYFFEE